MFAFNLTQAIWGIFYNLGHEEGVVLSIGNWECAVLFHFISIYIGLNTAHWGFIVNTGHEEGVVLNLGHWEGAVVFHFHLHWT